MELKELVAQAERIASEISSAPEQDRLKHHDQLHRTLELIKLQGGKVPSQLHRLDLDLVDEAVEASFDNMPV